MPWWKSAVAVAIMTLALVITKAGSTSIARELPNQDSPESLPLPLPSVVLQQGNGFNDRPLAKDSEFGDAPQRHADDSSTTNNDLFRNHVDDIIVAEEARVHDFAVGPKPTLNTDTSTDVITQAVVSRDENMSENRTWSSEPFDKAEEVFRLWEGMGHTTKQSIDELLKQALPKLLEFTYEVELSSACSASLMSLVFELRELKAWAFKMIDAWGKIPSGVLEGTVAELGSYDECLSIVVQDSKESPFNSERFRGQYCMLQVKPPLPPKPAPLTLQTRIFNFTNTSLEGTYLELLGQFSHGFYYKGARIGLCVPSVCTKDELQRMIDLGTKDFTLSMQVTSCETKEELHLDSLQITVMCVLAIVSILLFVGTAFDVIRMFSKSDEDKKPTEGKFVESLLAFSVYKNTKSLMDTSSTNSSIDSIHGLRFLSMVWIILTHTYIVALKETYSRLRSFMLIVEELPFQGIVNAWVSVDTFFFMGALLATYSHLNRLESSKGKVNFPRIIFGRVFRLSFSECFAVLLMFVWPLMANGPLWNEVVSPEVDKCKNYWYATLLYFNNWLPFEKMCLFHTWYLSADMQLFLLCLITLIPFYRTPKLGIIISIIIMTVGCLSSGFTTMVLNSPPTPLYNTPNEMEVWKVAEVTHMRTYSHLGPYAIGAILGYILHKRKTFSLSVIFQIFAWILSLVVGLSVLWGTYNWNRGYEVEAKVSFWYSALHRSVWTLAVAWVTFACETQRGGIVNKFLTWKAFVPLARLCYMMYLMHFYVLWTRTGVQRERISFSHYSVVCEFTVNVMFSIVLAFFAHLAFEAPSAALYKTHFRNCFKFAEMTITRKEKAMKDRDDSSSRL